ncbi:MAG: CbiX/SirB N-terminal domain-containing protein [candidate division Zixibacteria bacterium]|nr:CbiX/SirB N-terminal domain-containing protein [candidate division Zixibacteria bacterium]
MRAIKIAFRTITILLLLTSLVTAKDKLGLLVVAHGAPSPAWNQPVLDLESEIAETMQVAHPGLFGSIRVALMEFAEPSIATVISDMEDEGIDRVYVLPLFIAPSGHSLYDLPTILGLYSDRELVAELTEEGIKIVRTDMKITLGPTLDAEVIKSIAIDRAKAISSDPDSEAVIILAHGDRNFEPIWSSLAREVGSSVCADLGIAYFDYGFVGMGQAFISEGAPPIFRALGKHRRVLVLGLYLCSSIESIAQKAASRFGGGHGNSEAIFSGQDVRFADKGLLPDDRIADWVVQEASEWAQGL